MYYELEKLDREEALDKLESHKGRSALIPGSADEILAPFTEDVTDEFLDKHDSRDFPELVFHSAIAEEQTFPKDFGGMLTVPEYQPVISVSEVSGLLVEALGGERSTGMSIGRGGAADEAHDAHMSYLRENL